ncbi:MAG TPA: hypothetical protein VGO61_07500 [Steroidobacteraceae bacterium]|jgi:hypothetical protein|nr:hypothetical protein [Steroidobacteraceae bacterium]
MNQIDKKVSFRNVDGVSTRFVESQSRKVDALLLSGFDEMEHASQEQIP